MKVEIVRLIKDIDVVAIVNGVSPTYMMSVFYSYELSSLITFISDRVDRILHTDQTSVY